MNDQSRRREGIALPVITEKMLALDKLIREQQAKGRTYYALSDGRLLANAVEIFEAYEQDGDVRHVDP